MDLYAGPALATYSFGHGHPFSPDRYDAFWERIQREGLDRRAELRTPCTATREDLLLFHTEAYVDRVAALSRIGQGMLDPDTPVFEGIYEAGLTVVGTVLDAVSRVANGTSKRAFIPIAGLHHAHPGHSGGFCVFNDCAIAIQAFRLRHGLRRLAYVDIDAHHADGVYYGFERDPGLAFADFHEDGHFLFPGTGDGSERGKGDAVGTKLNFPLLPGSKDEAFFECWPQVEALLRRFEPEAVLLQCGADSLGGDPLADLNFSVAVHRHAAGALVRLAKQLCGGRLIALGGGGYDRGNIADAWCAVIEEMIGAD